MNSDPGPFPPADRQINRFLSEHRENARLLSINPPSAGAIGWSKREVFGILPSMSDQKSKDALSRWLRRQLEHGITVTEEVFGYLEATFGTRDLAAVVADEDASEVGSLMELLFYPDIDLQLKFEVQWGGESFSEDDRDAMVHALCGDLPVARLRLPGAQAPLLLPVPPFTCRTFVERLHICRKIHPRLDKILAASPHGQAGTMTRVQLRNARLVWHGHQVALMEQFLTRMPASAQNFSTDLEFLISILAEISEREDGYAFLTEKKFFYFKSLCSAEDFERKRTASNMEIMMLSGARSAHGNIDEWRMLMRRIDRICQALFGRTAFFQQPDSRHIDLQDSENIQDVIQKLS